MMYIKLENGYINTDITLIAVLFFYVAKSNIKEG